MKIRFLIYVALLGAGASIAVYMLIDRNDAHIGNQSVSSTTALPSKPVTAMLPTQKQTEAESAKQAPSVKEITRSPQRLQALARETGLQLVSPDSLQLSPAAIHLLELSPPEVETLNKLLASFLESLRRQEILHASITPNLSGEEIVVAPFDRSPIVNSFRDEVAAAIDPATGAFIAEQVVYDRSLAVGSSELRLHIEQGNDGLDRVVFTQSARRLDALDSETPIQKGKFLMAPTYELKSVHFLGKNVDSRYQHLFSAVDTLPRR